MNTSVDASPGFDVIVIGGGIAGASLAHWLAPHARVLILMLERESQPGGHSTGHSAALCMTRYGPPHLHALTRASLAFYENPPAGFSDRPLLRPHGALMDATSDQLPAREAHGSMLAPIHPEAVRLTAGQTIARVPALRPDRVAAAVYEPDAADMDVNAIHRGFLRTLRRHGGQRVCDAEVLGLRRADGLWRVQTRSQSWSAPVVVNAAGAWAQELAHLAGSRSIGLLPKRCSTFVFAAPGGLDIAHRPLVFGPAKTGASSLRPGCCSALRPTRTRYRRRMCSPKRWTSPLPLSASSP